MTPTTRLDHGRLVSLSTLTALLCGTLGAQVIPTGAGYATTEAKGYAQDLGRYAPLRSQYVYSSRVMPNSPLTIRTVRARLDSGRKFAGGHSLEVELWMSSQGREPAIGYSYSWAANRGPDFTQVMQKKNIFFPASTGGRPEPFGVTFPLDATFIYRGGAFLFEIRTHGTAFDYFNYYLDAATHTGLVRPLVLPQSTVGTGCPPDLRFWANREGRCTGGLFYNQGYTGIPGKRTQVLDFMGLSTTSSGSIPLPLDLTLIGAPGCMQYNDILAAVSVFSSSTATDGYTVSMWGQVPLNPSLVGAAVYNQWVVLDPTFNAAGAAVSPSVKTVISNGLFQGRSDCLHLFSYGRAGSVVFTGEEGAARWVDGRGLILELR